jgi:inner membrane protein COX18
MQRGLTRFFRTLGVAMVPLAMQVPSGLVLYWATSAVVGLAQTVALRYPRVRRRLGIPHTPSESRKPVRDVLRGIVTRTAAFWVDVRDKNFR